MKKAGNESLLVYDSANKSALSTLYKNNSFLDSELLAKYNKFFFYLANNFSISLNVLFFSSKNFIFVIFLKN